MKTKALCVGINDYPYEGNDLNGCVNDAHAWAALLVEHFSFARDNVRILTDSQATKEKMVAGVRDLGEDGRRSEGSADRRTERRHAGLH
jgi:hypothetical protein